ncbi:MULTISPECIES: A24 family peptidase C-terminal domain-containing protein [Metallosphaera]|uniref:Peptidase A24B, FlaK-like protein n=4 Tax=Metallosphaera TaxID=41980 RepID=A4YIH8_METS5|nr:Peptidase A24B, FlaK-like protein [Metallosphaera sedula DSM 5348]AIM28213.1 Peptidase A24B, FlaK-like protein [Metallosphaera sedula]QCO30380.1 peptidase A24 [Metallosphaera prunae]
MLPIYLLQVLLSVVMLLHTSILDLRYREVDPKIWLIYSPLIAFLYFDIHEVNLFIYLYSIVAVLAVFFGFYVISFMGGADLFAIIILGLANASVHPLLFSGLSQQGMEPLIVVLYSSVLIVLSGIINFARNFKYTSGLPLGTRLVLSFTARRIKVKQFLRSKFLFPLTEIDESGSESLRMGFSVDEDDSHWRDLYAKLVREGKLEEERYIWVAWGVPVLPFILLGYLISLVIGLPFS